MQSKESNSGCGIIFFFSGPRSFFFSLSTCGFENSPMKNETVVCDDKE